MRFPHLDKLRMFANVARHDSLASAAESLNLTKGAVSHQIRLVEQELGFTLFSRHARGITLTAHGEDLLATLQPAFETIEQIGGSNGWYYANWLWHLRGWIDWLAGGVGMRQTPRKQDPLKVGDHVDFWCVDAVETGRLLRLRAEMKLPGQAWLQFETEPHNGQTLICQTAIFKPHGLAGLMYWYGTYPFHWFIFKGMLKAIASKISTH